jgi:hypothetical protein
MSAPDPIPLLLMPTRELNTFIRSGQLPKPQRPLPEIADVIGRISQAASEAGIEVTPPNVKVSTAPKPPGGAGGQDKNKEFSPYLIGGIVLGVIVLVILIARS